MPEIIIPPRDHRGYWHYTYLVTDPSTGQWYVGKHSTRKLADGYRGSGNWIKEHLCPERLVIEILAFHATEEAAYLAELALVTDEIIIMDDRCMNKISGGWGLTTEAMNRFYADPMFRAKHLAGTKRANSDPRKRARLSKLQTLHAADPTVRVRLSNSAIQRWLDPEIRAKNAKGLKLAWTDPKTRAKHEFAWCDLEVKRKHSSGLRQAFASPEARLKLSIRTLRNQADPIKENKRLKALRLALATPEVKANRAKSQKRRWADPEVRAKKSQEMKRWWKYKLAKSYPLNHPTQGGGPRQP